MSAESTRESSPVGRTVLLMGPPGAGKGTQATHICDSYDLRHVATGDVLRRAVRDSTELGVVAKGYMDRGELVPEAVVIGMLREIIRELPCHEGALLDGFPRTTEQAEALDGMLSALGRSTEHVIDIEVPMDVLVTRLAGRWICRACQRPYNLETSPPAVDGVCDACGGELYQRTDDTSDSVTRRLEVYAEQTAPVSEYYRRRGVLRTIDGNADPASVTAAIDLVLGGRS